MNILDRFSLKGETARATGCKRGIGQLTMAFANEWAGKGVKVNAAAPGSIDTDNTEALRNDPTRSQQILARIPAGRWGKTQDFKGPVVFRLRMRLPACMAASCWWRMAGGGAESF